MAQGRHARGLLLTSVAISSMGFMSLFPILAPLGRELDLSEFEITSVIGMSSLTIFLLTPFWGRLSDIWGRRRVMMIGFFGFSLGTLVFIQVVQLGLDGVLVGVQLYLALILARVFVAAIMSASMPSTTAYMADITSSQERTRGMGAVGAASNVGTILGPALAVFTFLSLLAPLWIVSVAAFANGLLAWALLPESRSATPSGDTQRMPYTDPRIAPFIIVGVLVFIGNALVQQTVGFRFQDTLQLSAQATAETVGIAMILSAVAALGGQYFVVQRMGLAPLTLLKIAIPVLAFAFVMMAVFESRGWLMFAMMLQGFGMGLAAPGFTAGASLAVSAREQGAVAGVIASCGPLGATLGPLLGGALYELTPVLPYAFAAAMFVCLIAAFGWLERRVTVHEPPDGA
ncbi:MAG: MFS transporter [Pseudomonadota bacterium]